MPKLALFAMPLAAAILSVSCGAMPVSAESLSCSSVNGATLCSKSGSTSCQSVNGKTTCCETVGNRTECHDMPAANPPRRVQPQDQDEDQGKPDDDDAAPEPPLLLLPGRNVDISATLLSLLLSGSFIRPAVQTIILPPPPDPRPSRMREIVIAKTIHRNQQMLLLTGKLPVRRCVTQCGALNSLDRLHRP